MPLNREAKNTIRLYGLTVPAYTRHYWTDGTWHGDDCGCTDDRCAGFHHDVDEECGCLPVLLGQLQDQRAHDR